MKYTAGGILGKLGEALSVGVPLPPGMLALTVKDTNGKAASGISWQLTLPDGTAKTGKTGSEGRISVDGVPAGDCKLVLPDFEGNEAAPAATGPDASGGDQPQKTDSPPADPPANQTAAQ